MPALKDLAKAGMKVVVCCPDRVKGGAHKEAHRKVCIPIIVEELRKAAVELKDIKLIMCQGLHRKNTKTEMDWYLGEEIMDCFWPDRLIWHDSEDADNIVNFGFDELGDVVVATVVDIRW